MNTEDGISISLKNYLEAIDASTGTRVVQLLKTCNSGTRGGSVGEEGERRGRAEGRLQEVRVENTHNHLRTLPSLATISPAVIELKFALGVNYMTKDVPDTWRFDILINKQAKGYDCVRSA